MGEPDNVVARAITALREITLPADVVSSARETADEIERTWQRSPYIVSFAGDVQARTELVNTLWGERLLDPLARTPGNTTVRLRHGDRLMCLAGDRELHPPVAAPRDDSARKLVAEREQAERDAERNLPVLVEKRPAVWAFWLWLVRAILLLTHRQQIATLTAERLATANARRKLAVVEDREKQERAARELFSREVRAISSGEIVLTVPAVPAGIELVEAAIDGDLTIDASQPVDLATLSDAAATARAEHLAARAQSAFERFRGELDDTLSRAEGELKHRLAEVETFAVTTDRARYTAAQLERIKPHILASTTAVMEHASTHLGSALAELSSDWVGKVAAAANPDELKAAITAIEDQWIPVPQRIAEEVRILVAGGAGGVARDLYPEIVAPLSAHGLPDQHLQALKRAPAVGAVPILPSLANPSTSKVGGSWLTGLFKSFDTRRADVREQVHRRVEHLREVAAAELLDAEPKLHAAIGQALAVELARALDLQQDWYKQRLAAEREAVELERAKLLPLYDQRDQLVFLASTLTRSGGSDRDLPSST